jgi:putative tryptophan/tyrosine transport system substrate-binding protein
MLWNAADLGMTLRYRAAEDAASLLGIKVQTLGVREPDDFEHAFAEMTGERPDAILMVSDALTMLNRRRVVEFANTNRLPTIFETDAPVRDGGLMSYGPRRARSAKEPPISWSTSYAARGPRTCTSNCPRTSSSWSISRRRRRSASAFRRP